MSPTQILALGAAAASVYAATTVACKPGRSIGIEINTRKFVIDHHGWRNKGDTRHCTIWANKIALTALLIIVALLCASQAFARGSHGYHPHPHHSSAHTVFHHGR
jgi:hypothetical protein